MSNVNPCSDVGKMYLNQDNDNDGKADYYLYLNSNFILNGSTNDFSAGQILMTDQGITYSKVRYYKPLADMLYKVDANNNAMALDNSTFYRASRAFPYNTPLRWIATTPNKVVFERPADNDPNKNIVSVIYDYKYKYAVGFYDNSNSAYRYNQIPDMSYMGNNPTYITTLPGTYGNRRRSWSSEQSSSTCKNYELHRCGNGIVETSNSSYMNTFTSEQCDGTAWVPSGYTCTSTCTLQAVVVKPTCTLSTSPGVIVVWTSAQASWTISGNYTNTPQITYTPNTRIITGLPYTVTTANGQRTITPTHTGAYTLSMTVSNSAWSSVCTAPITVNPPPQNLSCTLTLSPNPVYVNQTAAVTWNVTGGTFVWTYINVSPLIAWWPHWVNTNQYTWTTYAIPTTVGDYTFNMLVNNSQSSALCTGILHVISNTPPTCSLTTSTPTITSGGTAILNGSYTNATLATMTPFISWLNFIYPTRSNSSISVHPIVTTTYILTVNGLSWTTPAVCPVTVTVTNPIAPTCSLTTNTPTITSGGTAILSGWYTHATLANITPTIPGLNFIYPTRSNSNISVHPIITTTYTMLVTWQAGTTPAVCPVTVTVLGSAQLSLTKALINNIPYHSGDLVSFRIDFANIGNITTHNNILSDYLPASLTYENSQIYGITAPYTFGTGINGNNILVEYSGFTLLPGQQWYMIITGKFKWYQRSNQTLNNVFLSSNETNILYASALFYAYAPSANATITKTVNKVSYYPGEDARFTIAVTNNGPDAIDNVQLIDTWPNSSCIVADPLWTANMPMTMTNSSNPYAWNVNTSLPVGQTAYLYLTWHIANNPSCIGTYINVVDLRYTVNGVLKTGQAYTNINVIIVPTSSMTIEKKIISYGNNVGDNVQYEIVYTNNWTATITNYNVVDYWPGTLNFGSASPMPTTQTTTSWWMLLNRIFTTPLVPNGSGKITLNGTIR